MKELNIPCVEPKKRWVGGKFDYAVHRFPIRGGITPREMLRQLLIESQYETQQAMLKTLQTFLFAGGKKDDSGS
jgi:hypothetical protein